MVESPPMRRWVLLALGLMLGSLTLSVGLAAQDTLSQQVLRLLSRDNTWTGVNTYASTVGITLQSGALAPSTTTNRLYNLQGNLFFNGVLVAPSSGVGTVFSVGLAAPPIFTVASSPVTSSGILTLGLATETANLVWAGPSTGADAAPTFRTLVDADIPNTITIACTDCVTWASVNKTGSSLADLATRSATDLTSGTLPNGRFPATLPAASGVNLTALNATQLTSGTIPDARFPATLPALSGVNLTALNATNLASGTVGCARFPALTGDITSSAGACATTLANTAVTPNTYGDATHTLTVTVDAKGRLTSVSTNAITFGTVDLASGVTGVLPIANGGTALSTAPTNGQLLIGNGTDYTLAAVTGTANQVVVTNGAGSITLSTPQSIGTSSTPQFARLGLGAGAGATALLTAAGQLDLGFVNVGNCGAAATVNWNSGEIQKTTLSAATCTLTFSNPIAGRTYLLLVIEDATGGRLVTWPGSVKWQGGAAPTLTVTANKIDRCQFSYDGTSYLGQCSLNY